MYKIWIWNKIVNLINVYKKNKVGFFFLYFLLWMKGVLVLISLLSDYVVLKFFNIWMYIWLI